MEEYGLIGRQLHHSRSPGIWEGLFAALPDAATVRRVYSLFPLPTVDHVTQLVDTHPDLRGFNVTIPYKESVIPLLDHLTDTARAVGAVNTVRVDRSGGQPRLTGHNTDASGFLIALRQALGENPIPAQALILGTGGAAKAVGYALGSAGVHVTYVSRTPQGSACINYDALSHRMMMEQHHLIVNATPVGMYPDTLDAPDIPYHLLGPDHVLFDLVYNPAVTRFMALGAEAGALVTNGMAMLRQQAWEALQFFRQTL